MEQGAWKTVGEQMGDKGTARGRTSMQRANDMIDTLAAALPQAHAMFTARSQLNRLSTPRGNKLL